MKLVLVLLPILALTSRAEDDSLMSVHRIETETADRIQARVLDPILGAGQSSVFVKVKLEVMREQDRSDRMGEGHSAKLRSKMEISVTTATAQWGMDVDPLMGSFGVGNSVISPHKDTRGQTQAQDARQSSSTKEERSMMSNRFTMIRLVVLHDANVSPSKIAGVRAALLAVYKWESGVDIKFHPVEFSALK